jgi:NADH-quinone oxidoreductase subunit L
MALAWVIPALGVGAFIVIVTLGRGPGRGLAVVATGAALAGFALFWPVLIDMLRSGEAGYSIGWLEAGGARFTWGMTIDPLAMVMVGLVTLAALGIQVYSWSYMAGEPRFAWYFAVHALFASAMLTLVLADNFLLFYFAWELVGLCSYLLIGFWYERRSAAEAAKKAFITTRIGDVGLLIAILLLFAQTGTFQMSEIFEQAHAGGMSQGVVTASAVLLFIGAMGKSAQFPLHVWLPDAMEGPAPVSALIHAATMVVAGVYLVARSFPLFELSDPAMLLVASVGVITSLMAGTMALVMTDLKRVLAYSTITDLGFMMLALGAGGVTAAMLHLVVHGFSKAALFLGAGSVTHGTDQTDIREMGGLWRKMPWTTAVFGIGALGLGGVPPLGGFFSKDEVLSAVWDGRGGLFLALGLLVAFIKALYMARVFFAVFLGRLKPQNEHAHESSFPMVAPMVVFAFLALTLGLLALNYTDAYQGFGTFVFAGEPEPFHLNVWIALTSVGLAAIGFALAWAAYVRGSLSTERLAARFGWLHRLWTRKYYMDEAYQWAIDRVVLAAGEAVALFDRAVVNDVGVNGAGGAAVQAGRRLRYLQTGRLYGYALAMVLGFLAIGAAWWLTRA